jgi:hypothetical protein
LLFVVVREIEAERRHVTVFALFEMAKRYYNYAAYVCDNGPDEGPEDDPTIVTNCWLYVTATADPERAKAAALDGTANLCASYERDGYAD